MTDCIHRLAVKSTEKCPSCSGNVMVKVFGCPIHRLCSVGKAVYAKTPGRYMVCDDCPDRHDYIETFDAMAVRSTQ